MTNGSGSDAESVVRGIKRRTRTKYSSEEKVHIVLERLRGEGNRSALDYERDISVD